MTKRFLLAVALLGALLAFSAPISAQPRGGGGFYYCYGREPQFVPAGEHLFCSATFQFMTATDGGGDGATCDGITDLVTHWGIVGPSGRLPNWRITPLKISRSTSSASRWSWARWLAAP